MTMEFTRQIIQRCCRSILERYIGKYLDRKLELDQLTGDCVNGKFQIKELTLNVHTVNELLSSFNFPLKLIEGYVESLFISVPWTSLMAAPSNMEVTDLQLTFQVTDELKIHDKETVISTMETVMSTFVSSGELARTVLEDAKNNDNIAQSEEEESLQSFIKIIDAVCSRFCVELNKVTIRIESPSMQKSNMFTAIEIRGKTVRFMDEQMRACEQDSNSPELITSQPHGIGDITNLNKFLYLEGFSFFTDVYILPDLESQEKLVTSMHLRREMEKFQSPNQSLYKSDMTEFYSCHQSINMNNSILGSAADQKNIFENELFTNPIKFAEIIGRTEIVFRLKNTESKKNVESPEKKIETEINIEGIYCFITPSQIEIIKRLASSISITNNEYDTTMGKPMKREDFATIVKRFEENESKTIHTHRKIIGGGLQGDGNWQNPEDFVEFKSINLNERVGTSQNNFNSLKNMGESREEVIMKAKLGTVLVVIPHDDVLSSLNVNKQESFDVAINELQQLSDSFFKKCDGLKFLPRMELCKNRPIFDKLFSNDHLRVIGTSVVNTYVTNKIGCHEKMISKLLFSKCDVIEYLTAESVPGSSVPIHIPLLDFSVCDNDENDADIKITAQCSDDTNGKLKIDVYINQCRSEVDLSILDRISHLVKTRPFFYSNESAKSDHISPLNQELFASSIKPNKVDVGNNIKIICEKWTLDIRIPKADLRDSITSRTPYNHRYVHNEYISLVMKNVDSSLNIGVEDSVNFEIECSEIMGDFAGVEQELSQIERRIFLAKRSNISKIKVNVGIDGNIANTLKSKSSSNKRDNEDIGNPRREGPFAQITRTMDGGEDEKIVQAGSRSEIIDFQIGCMENASVKLKFDIPLLRLNIFEKKFFEILYNRLVNDLALWNLSSPVFRTTHDDSFKINAIGSFHECETGSPTFHRDDSLDTLNGENDVIEKDEFDRNVPHLFCASVNVTKCIVLCNTVVRRNGLFHNDGQVCFQIDNVHIGTTYGYHGDGNQTFFHTTATKVMIGSSNVKAIPSVIESNDFGKWDNSDINMEHVGGYDCGDALGIVLDMKYRPDENIKDVLVAISLRNSLIYAKPINDIGLLWATQLAELFTLVDDEIPGYELPDVATDFHLSIENTLIGYDHVWVNPHSNLKLRAELGQCNFSNSVINEINTIRTACIIEKSRLYLCEKEDSCEDLSNYVLILDIGLVHLDLMFPVGNSENSNANIPMFEIKCRNDIVEAWVCSDSLSALFKVVIEFSQSDKIKSSNDTEDSEKSDFVASDGDKLSTVNLGECEGAKLPDHVEKKIQALVQDAMIEKAPYGIDIGADAVNEFRSHSRPLGEKLERNKKFSAGDDEFCMVDDDVLGSGITNTAGEARVRYFDVNGEVKNTDNDILLDLYHMPGPGPWKATDLPNLPVNHERPLVRYLFKDLSVRLHVFGGKDLTAYNNERKSYSTDEYREGRGKGQKINPKEQGGPNRDHSVSIVIELSKITFSQQIFRKSAKFLSTTSFSIFDILIIDRLYSSDIKEMLYQYSNAGVPRRTNAPILSVKIAETQSREGKMRISMLPIKINIDQDTLEFLKEFIEETISSVELPSNLKPKPLSQNRATIEVPADLKYGTSSTRFDEKKQIYPDISSESLPVEPLIPSPAVRNDLGDISYLEKCVTARNNIPDLDLGLNEKNECFHVANEKDVNKDVDNVTMDTLDTDMSGDWSDECNSNFIALKHNEEHVLPANDILSRSGMCQSIYQQTTGDLLDTNINENEENQNILAEIEGINDSMTSSSSTACADTKINQGNEDITNEEEGDFIRTNTFFKEFVFSPSVNIYIDYQGKRKISLEKSGPIVGILMAFGQLNQMPITLRELENRQGMLGIGRCLSYAAEEWIEDLKNNRISVITSCGPISPFFEIGKGIRDLIFLPVEEMQKEDGHVVKGIQKGVGSFGMSSAAGIVGIAQTVTGFVQSLAEMTLREIKPNEMMLNRRNRRSTTSQTMNPTNIRHSLQLAYCIICDGYSQTREDLELAAQEDRASGASVMRSAFRYAVPTFLSPVVMATQVTYQLLGGLRNQLRPETFQDERRKWGEDNVPGGVGRH